MPVIEKRRFEVRHIAYIIIGIICIIAIGMAVYIQFFQDEKIGVILGITNEEDDDEIINLKGNFLNNFNNNIEIIEPYTGEIEKIREKEDLIFLGYNIQEQKESYTVDLKIPYFNINSEVARQFNQDIKAIFRDRAEDVISSINGTNAIYNVKYKAYVKNNILSLVVLSELKEDDNSERIIIQTYNYNIAEDKKVNIDEILQIKEIDANQANSKIKNEIDKSQEQNIKLSELGYNVIVRDTNIDMYKIENAEEYFLGDKGYLYILYSYGNEEYTSEIDVVIFR